MALPVPNIIMAQKTYFIRFTFTWVSQV